MKHIPTGRYKVKPVRILGGGRVEGYPEDIEVRKAAPAFLFNGALLKRESLSFKRSRLIGKRQWIATRTV